jgi:uncharacterized protein (DUF302 family)
MTAYAHKRTFAEPFDVILGRTRKALADQGFGIPAEIDTQAVFRNKLNRESPARIILGACLPQVAWEALQAEPDIAVLLPCNVVVREVEGGTEVAAIAPKVLFTLTSKIDPAHAEIVDRSILAALNAI